MIRIAVLRAGAHDPFPAVETALADPDGLLAAGGDLSPERLLDAYRHGIFPWFSAGDPILWWSPATRTVFDSNRVHVSDRLRRWLKKCDWTLRADSAFAEVVLACASPRATQPTTWITPEMFAAYLRLHELGYAHSVEIFDGDGLVGGIYGVAVGRMFFGESMFSYATNASKVALIALCRMLASNGFPLLDAQVSSPHLTTMGALEMPRAQFVDHVATYSEKPGLPGNWSALWTIGAARSLV